MICHKFDNNSSDLCIKALLEGKVVVVPTDTVYGFSGLVDDSLNVKSKIMNIKGRSETKPFIQLIAEPEDIFKYTEDLIPEKLLKYWPGPLTVIVNDLRLKNESIQTTAFRCPGDKWLRKIIKECGKPVYSTSLNRSGMPVLENESEIIEEFSSEADLIVLDGNKTDAKPSTIVCIQNKEIKVLRQGELIIDI